MNPKFLSILLALGAVLLIPAAAQNQGIYLTSYSTGGWFDVPAAATLAPTPVTFEAWITYDDATIPPFPAWVYPTIARKNFGPSGEEWFLRVQAHQGGSKVLAWQVRGASGTTSAANWTFQAGELLPWTHVAGTYDGTTLRLYINGAEKATASASGSIPAAGGALRIGAGDVVPGSAWEGWNGAIDEVRLWNVVRTPAEIQAGMFQTISTAPGLEAAWHLDGGVMDATGNGHDGTVSGAGAFAPVTLPSQEYQLNSAVASMTMNGTADPGPFAPISQVSLVGQVDTLDLASTNAGQPWDLAVQLPGQTLPFSTYGVVTLGAQVVNIDVLSSSTVFLFGGLLNNFPPSALSFPIVAPFPLQAGLQMVVLDPGTIDNFALSHAVDYSVVPCQPQQNFDNLTTGVGNYPLGWSNGGGTAEWQVHTGTTSSSATGPIAGANSPPNYMYCETSGSGGTANFLMDTCQIPIATLTNFTLNFRLSRIGTAIGTLNVWMDDGTGTFPTLLTTYTGQEPTMTDWTPESIPFVPAANTVAFRFDYTGGASYYGDIAIDDFDVQ